MTTKVVGVSFKQNGRVYYFKSENFAFEIGMNLIVETEKGLQYAFVVVPEREIEEESIGIPLKPVIRIATEDDSKKYEKNLKDAVKALEDARGFIEKLKLDMRILDASFTFDRNQLLFNFVADGRIDFRELAKKLAQVYHTRIELRQIGVRDKAKEIGGLGPCGRFLCCSSFLTDFNSVSINMAKNQFIALNPTKINGVCGRLLCCLNYEDKLYTELKQNLPNVGSYVTISEGRGKIISLDVFQEKATIELRDKRIVVVNCGDLDESDS